MPNTSVAILILSDKLELTREFIDLFTENPESCYFPRDLRYKSASQNFIPKYYKGFIDGHLSGESSPIYLYGMSNEFWPELQNSTDIPFLNSWSETIGIVYLNRENSLKPAESNQTSMTHFVESINKLRSGFQKAYPLWNRSGRKMVIFNLGLKYDDEIGEALEISSEFEVYLENVPDVSGNVFDYQRVSWN
jgi:hypothetical protein